MSRNQYAGTCYRCREAVEPNAGHFERYAGGWRVQHAECAIAYRGSDRNATGPRPVVNPAKQRHHRAKTCVECGASFESRIHDQRRCKSCIAARKTSPAKLLD